MLGKKDKELKMLWNRLMQYQTAFSLPSELIFFYGSTDWLNARSVIDLGTGNGYYLSKLVKRFPTKTYVGVDHEPSYINIAAKRGSAKQDYHNCRVRFEIKDISEVKGKFDFALARLLVQHLNSIEAFLCHVHGILHLDGTLLVVESNDSARRFYPELPHMENFFSTFKNARKEAGFDRNAGFIIRSRAEDLGFQLVKEMNLLIPSTLTSYKMLFFKSYQTIFEIVKCNYGIDFDYNTLNSELQSWLNTPNSYAQIGVHMACYKRR